MVWRDAAGARFHIAPRFCDLPLAGLAMVAVDMPIGLPESGRRGCDMAARALLPPDRRASVFLDFRRKLLSFSDYAGAIAWAKADGKGFSKQAWNILPRIADIDSWITPARQARVRECHPELVFLRMNAFRPLPPKRTPAGQDLRRLLLRRRGFAGLDALARALPARRAALDDLYDAAALALAAERFAKGEGSCVGEGLRDARGLRMEIWY
ncbi:MAG: DUF429 domain-containing protein [Alphaproteobacteria bacterium]|nr:DUF429 domain-containing protein [Alphaproteobacteria bacterium]